LPIKPLSTSPTLIHIVRTSNHSSHHSIRYPLHKLHLHPQLNPQITTYAASSYAPITACPSYPQTNCSARMDLTRSCSLRRASFTLFPFLPPEIRMCIWEMAVEAREGRVIIPVEECIHPPHSSEKTGIRCLCNTRRSKVRRFPFKLHIPTNKVQAALTLYTVGHTTTGACPAPCVSAIAGRCQESIH
jgi:hypothetical protein